ncbi:hypothetical protein M8C21_020625 [Ambrosia artemisiifolia]|uniref:Uncharacterized protein n=1 Tax=Ambrosia artemisiifolia TaxID=4212 RepID=A0AAD5DEC9_AMBAR|nr:hypothetical protein M8C21_020625 [Ambrosia artemisiifolia]
MSDEEPVDQKKYFEELCKPKCVRAWLDYQIGKAIAHLKAKVQGRVLSLPSG